MKNIYDEAGFRIKELREMNGYTREQFAEKVDLSPKFLYEVEKGKKGFSADTLFRISKSLSVTCEYILTGSNYSTYENIVMEELNLYNATQLNKIKKLLRIVYELQID